jgi:cleavage stimulation factor subunit 3
MYLGIDAIADRDLGFALARKGTATNSLGKTETQHSLMSTGTPQGTKRVASPDYRNKREDNRGVGGGGGSGGDYPGNKRMRPSSPPRGADRDRETRWEGPSSRRRPFSPPPPTSSWDREDRPRAREPLPTSRAQEREEEKPRQISIPPVISWFVGDLPASSSFDGDFLCFWRLILKQRLNAFFFI